METLGDKILKKMSKKYSCKFCLYKCSRKYNLDRHLLTCKFKMETNGDESMSKMSKSSADDNTVTKHICEECNKEYSSRNGLWKHNKTYHSKKDDDISDKELIMMLIKENSEFKNMMMKVVENGTNNTTNNNTTTHINSHNKAFNLNFFLNETCKDAMNITDFISSIKLNLEDLENTGRRGYIEGISNIILKNLNNIEQHMRPLHCSDQKREILYVKDNNEWTKETDDKPILTKAIKNVAHKNIKQIQYWRDKNPDCTSCDSRKNDLYLKIVSNSMNGLTEEEGHRNIDKIISNVAKETVIQKDLH